MFYQIMSILNKILLTLNILTVKSRDKSSPSFLTCRANLITAMVNKKPLETAAVIALE